MSERFIERMSKIALEFPGSPLVAKFVNRASEGHPTRDEEPYTHFCVYFAGFDPNNRKIFIGHHKKSGLWLFNGGHMDKGEVPEESLDREMGEEWGLKVKLEDIGKPRLLTITPINNPTKQKCTSHYDIWYFVPLSEAVFKPDQDLLATEFHTTGWKTIDEARTLIIDPATLLAIDEFEKLFDR
ncbi:MAG: NUDIX domain-containing protein [Parachlamydiales bacterium]